MEIKLSSKKIEQQLSTLIIIGNQIMANLAALTTEVARNTAVAESAVVLLNGVKTEQAAIDAITAQVKTAADALAQAVIANTP
jgi:hypothetical protein